MKYELVFNCSQNGSGVFTCSVVSDSIKGVYDEFERVCKAQNYDIVKAFLPNAIKQ